MRQHTTRPGGGRPWSLATSRTFREGSAPAALPDQGIGVELRTVFLGDHDWSHVAVTVAQDGTAARITDAAVARTARFLALDVDGREYLRTVWHGQDANVTLDPGVSHPAGQQPPVYCSHIRDGLPHPLRGNTSHVRHNHARRRREPA